MSAPTPMPKRVLSQSEIEGLKDRNRSREEDMKPSGERGFYTPQDEGRSASERRAIKRSERILQRGDPRNVEVSKPERGRMEGRRKELVEWFKKHMVPKTHIDQRASGDPAFRKAVNMVAKVEMSQEFNRLAIEFKNISRVLWPDDPSMSNLETIRPDVL